MLVKLLKRKHPEYRGESLRRNRDLFVGGDAFRERVSEYLPKHEVEPADVYKRRCSTAHYINYVAPLVNLFASWLFTCEPKAEPVEGDADAFYDEFAEDCDGLGTDIDAFLRARMVDAFVDGSAFWRVQYPANTQLPTTATRGDWQRSGAGRAELVPMPASSVVNWRRDESGRLVWLLEHTRTQELVEIWDADVSITDTWTLWRADGAHRRWSAKSTLAKPLAPDADVAEVEPPFDPTHTMPIVDLVLPPEMRLVNLLASAQLEIFRKRVALSWAIDRTCYALLVLKTANRKQPPALGAGYYLTLGPSDAIEWAAPPATPYDTIGAYITTLKDELHRVAIAMAQGTDNNAAAIGRSGESKEADANATVKVLQALGKLVVLADERTFDLVSLGRGEKLRWTASGMDEYDASDLMSLVESNVGAMMAEIQSPTFKREMQTRIALAALGESIDEATKKQIREEIAAAIESESADDDKAQDPADEAAPPLADVPNDSTAPSQVSARQRDARPVAPAVPPAARAPA